MSGASYTSEKKEVHHNKALLSSEQVVKAIRASMCSLDRSRWWGNRWLTKQQISAPLSRHIDIFELLRGAKPNLVRATSSDHTDLTDKEKKIHFKMLNVNFKLFIAALQCWTRSPPRLEIHNKETKKKLQTCSVMRFYMSRLSKKQQNAPDPYKIPAVKIQ